VAMHAIPTERHHSNPPGSVQCSLSSLIPILLEYLNVEEELQIHKQFLGSEWRPNGQVLWSGILREEAQKWADEHDMQTLTTAMGCLMDPMAPSCLRKDKSSLGWTRYIKGASAVFAWHIAREEKVTVLSPPPPERFHPSGLTNQAIEEPILKSAIAGGAVLQIAMVHPTVKGAENFSYQIWPVDETATWIAEFATVALKKRRWRSVRLDPQQMAVRRSIEAEELSGIYTWCQLLEPGTGAGENRPSTKTKSKVSKG